MGERQETVRERARITVTRRALPRHRPTVCPTARDDGYLRQAGNAKLRGCVEQTLTASSTRDAANAKYRMSAYFHDIDPIAFSAGPVSVHWYGLMYLAAFVTAWLLGRHRLRKGRLGITEEQFGDLVFYGMLGIILGGRVGYMLFYASDQLVADPLSLFRVWEGGMSFHGGLLGVLAAGLWWSRRVRVHYFDAIDFVAPLVPIGLGFGRIGNFVGGELWGRTTDVPWAMIFPRALDSLDKSSEQLKAMYLAGELDGYARHPSQLYQAFLEGVVLFAIVWIYSSRPRPRYAVSGVFALVYGAGRFAVEFVREPDAQLGYLAFGWLTMGQVLSLPMIVVGLLLLALSRRQPQGHETSR
jgi:phosphatidylglycerol---prolipoprotein diacylglyceryl transferase